MVLAEFLTEWNRADTTVEVQTSGSTGAPKSMLVEKARMMASARMTNDFLGLSHGDIALLCMDLKYIGAKMMVVRSLERRLRLIEVAPTGHPLANLPKEIANQKIDFAAMVPLQVHNSLQVEEEAQRLRNIRHLIIGGGAVDEKTAQQLHSFPNAVWSTYGMTETLSHIALRRMNGPDASLWYTPFTGIRLSLDHEGCLIIDAPMLCDARLYTNDQAELLPNGCFRILGRKDNVIVSGGVKIQIEEVERILTPVLRYPFQITYVADEKFGQALVLLTEDPNPQKLEAICHKVLPKYWAPRQYLHTNHLPWTETGKAARQAAQRLATALLFA